MTQGITPFLWFDKETEEAMNFYIEVFNGSPQKRGESKVVNVTRYEKGMEVPGGVTDTNKIITAEFLLDGVRFMALDGGPIFKFTEATSFYIECEDQSEMDYFYGKLSAVPESEQCGWVKDKYGLSWQVVPEKMNAMMLDSNRTKAIAACNAMLKMKRIDLATMEKAFNEA